MSVLLAIETSTAVGSVALRGPAGEVSEIMIGGSQRQNESLLPAIERLLRQHVVERDQLGAIVIGAGPGSFTGLRVAAATAKGLCHTLGLPLYAYSALLAAAADFRSAAGAVCALFDARRDEVYSATYSFDGGLQVIREPRVETIGVAVAAQPERTLFVGDGALKHRTEITRAGRMISADERTVPRASALLWLAEHHPGRGKVDSPAHWEPDYIRASGAERGIRG